MDEEKWCVGDDNLFENERIEKSKVSKKIHPPPDRDSAWLGKTENFEDVEKIVCLKKNDST